MTFSTMVSQLAGGLLVSIEIFLLTLAGSLPLGLLVAFGRMSKWKPLRLLVQLYISIMRGTPLVLQLMVVYFGPPMLFGWNIPRFSSVILGMILNYAAYFAEIYRGGIESMPAGQYEAAAVLGYTKTQTFCKIIMPQVFKRILPSVTNEVITLVKDTSLARIISLQEVIWAGYSFLKGSHGYSGLIWPLFFTGVYYLVFNGILTLFFGWLEKKLDYFRA